MSSRKVIYDVRRRFLVEILGEVSWIESDAPGHEPRIIEKWEPWEAFPDIDQARSAADGLVYEHEGARVVDLYPDGLKPDLKP